MVRRQRLPGPRAEGAAVSGAGFGAARPPRGRELAGKVALVTGGAKGIGRETARALGAAGARLAITGRDRAALEAQAARLAAEGIEALPIQGDVADPAACRAAVEATLARYGRLDILINNAGASMRGRLADTDPALFRRIVEINFLGAAYMSAAALPALVASRGSLVFISSLSALKGLPGIAPYGAAKAALSPLSESIRAEHAADGVHVGLVYVGFTENDAGKTFYTADGSLAPLERPKNHATQAQVARAVVSLVLRRRRRLTLTPVGLLAKAAYALFPGLTDDVIAHFAGRSAMYGVGVAEEKKP